MKSIITPLLKYEIVETIKNQLFSTIANTYFTIGRPIRWGTDSNETGDVEDIIYTTDTRNQLFRDMIAIKKVQSADMALVIPRVDWVDNFKYDPYSDSVELFTHEQTKTVGNVAANVGETSIYEVDVGCFTGNISVGNVISIGTETKEVVGINVTSGILTVNTALNLTYASNSLTRLDNTYPKYANTFYVRNSKDQVFKCLDNANTNSTIEPTIDIDGQLPENAYIEPGDGYKWKYMYTIPYGLKQKFFTRNWMPVLSENQVTAGSVDGRIDIIKILSGGSGYYGGESSPSLPIATVSGDGTGAVVTANVVSGVIVDMNILKGGAAYTNAVITIVDSNQLVNGTPASFDVVIGPRGGHGSDPLRELGCYSIMTTVELDGTEGGKIPVGSVGLGGDFDFRQIAIIRDPLTANGLYANASVYRATTRVTTTDPGVTNFSNDETVIGSGIIGTVVSWDPNTNELDLNNINGTPVVGTQIVGQTSGATTTILNVSQPEIKLFSGDVLYIENRDKVVRDVDQSEQIKIVLSF